MPGPISRRDRAQLETAQALDDVLVPADRLAEFAIARYVDADLRLSPHHFGDRFLQALVVRRLIELLATLLGAHDVLQRLRPDQASDMRGQDAVGACFHVLLLLSVWKSTDNCRQMMEAERSFAIASCS